MQRSYLLKRPGASGAKSLFTLQRGVSRLLRKEHPNNAGQCWRVGCCRVVGTMTQSQPHLSISQQHHKNKALKIYFRCKHVMFTVPFATSFTAANTHSHVRIQPSHCHGSNEHTAQTNQTSVLWSPDRCAPSYRFRSLWPLFFSLAYLSLHRTISDSQSKQTALLRVLGPVFACLRLRPGRS